MKQVILLGRYRVYKHNRRWIVTAQRSHGDACISSHASQATALSAARRYHESDLDKDRRWEQLVRRFV
jgi:hypothetical protein